MPSFFTSKIVSQAQKSSTSTVLPELVNKDSIERIAITLSNISGNHKTLHADDMLETLKASAKLAATTRGVTATDADWKLFVNDALLEEFITAHSSSFPSNKDSIGILQDAKKSAGVPLTDSLMNKNYTKEHFDQATLLVKETLGKCFSISKEKKNLLTTYLALNVPLEQLSETWRSKPLAEAFHPRLIPLRHTETDFRKRGEKGLSDPYLANPSIEYVKNAVDGHKQSVNKGNITAAERSA